MKYGAAIWLMCLSLALLLIFQGFWLRKIYREQAEILSKDTDAIFQKVLFEMQDTLLQKNIDEFKIQGLDSTQTELPDFSQIKGDFDAPPPTYFWSHKDRFMLIGKEFKQTMDSLRERGLTRRSDSLYKKKVQVYYHTAKKDSTSHRHRKVLHHIFKNPDFSRFIINITTDSLSLEAIKKNYAFALQKTGLHLSFEVYRYQYGDKKPDSTGLQTQAFECIPQKSTYYVAAFSNYEWWIFQNMYSHWAFALLLTGITAGAFWLVHQSLLQQKKLSNLKNEFISNVTHELKTPVSTISVAIEALQNFNILSDPALTEEYLEISKNELKRLNILIDKILKTALFEQKGLTLQKERILMNELIAQILNSLKLLFEKQGAKVQFTQEGEQFRIEADATHLTNVIYNLIDNALKYSSQSPEIHLHLQTKGNEMILSVADKGIGIAPEYQKKVFENFFRVPTGNLHNTKGYGLGLSYVAKVVHQHAGKITLKSEPGKGSNFEISLPIQEV